MFVSSDRFAASIVSSHDVATRCDVLDKTGRLVIAQLDVIGGNVSVDANRKTRRQTSLTLQDPSGNLVPDEVNDLLQPYSGHQIQLWRGISWRDGTEELFPLGTFEPYNPRTSDTGDSLEITLDAYDRSKLISRIRWRNPYVIPSGGNVGTVIREALETRIPGMQYNFQPTNSTVPGAILGPTADHDPWEDLVKIAASDGMELFFDARGVCVLRSIPDPDKDMVTKIFDDGENSVVTSFRRENDASKMYTGIIVYSESSELPKPIRVEVWRKDTDLRIPYFLPTGLIQNEAQARATGAALLRRVGRAEFSCEITAIPDPRIEDGDVVRVTRERARLDNPFVISGITIPLDADSEMTVSTELRRTADLAEA
jgi:hypothetical protein